MVDKVTVSFRPEPNYWDFGNFKPEKKNYFIKIDRELWENYVKARYVFELLNKQLSELAHKKVK